jgi:hypothetical protein
MARVNFPTGDDASLFDGAVDAYTFEVIGDGQVAYVCGHCRSPYLLSTVRELSREGQSGCARCRRALRRTFVPPRDADGAKHLRFEYVALASNVARYVRNGIDPRGAGYPRDGRPAGHDPMPALPRNGPWMLEDGRELHECVAAYLNARNPHVYRTHMELGGDSAPPGLAHSLAIVRLHPWLSLVRGSWISDGSMAALATTWGHGADAVRAVDLKAMHARGWARWDLDGRRIEDPYLRSASQAVLLVPHHVPPEAMAEVVVPDNRTRALVMEDIGRGSSGSVPIAVRVDSTRFFKRPIDLRLSRFVA